MNIERFVAFLPFYLLTVILVIGLAQGTSQAVTVLGENSPLPGSHRFVIDAGHGGIDGGAVSVTGEKESVLNLSVARRLSDLLRFLGYETKMLRTDDVSLHTGGLTVAAKKVSDLKYRVAAVNNTENAILISLHQNFFSDSQYCGAQVFYAGDAVSKAMAGQLQRALNQNLCADSHRKEKSAGGIYLMQHIQVPGVLIECGFLSNPREAALLSSAAYQKKLCCVLAAALSSFVET